MLALDISNHQGALTAAQVVAMRAAGVEKVVVGLQYPGAAYPRGVAHQQLQVLRDGGMPHLEVYLESTPCEVAWPNVIGQRDRIERAWIAVETNSGFTDNTAIDAALAFADALNLPQPAGIYTSAYMWSLLMSAVDWYRGRPLWVAEYDEQPNLVAPGFGGWWLHEMKQYSEHGEIPGLGFEVDLDYCEENAVAQSKPLSSGDVTGIWMKAWSMEHGNAQVPLPDHIRQLDIVALEQAGDGADVYTITIERD